MRKKGQKLVANKSSDRRNYSKLNLNLNISLILNLRPPLGKGSISIKKARQKYRRTTNVT